MKATFNIGKERREGELIKANNRTVWVKIAYKKKISEEGAKAVFQVFEKTIKRHKIKHNVVIEGEKNE